MRIIVAGSRNFEDYDVVANRILEFFRENKITEQDMSRVEIISGTAKGVDRLGERFAQEHGCKLTRMPADWDNYGRSAGMIRNAEMAKYAAADPRKESILIAFWNGESHGTRGMIDIAYKHGLEIIVERIDRLKGNKELWKR